MALKAVEITFQLGGVRTAKLSLPEVEDSITGRADRVKMARAFAEQIVNSLYTNDTLAISQDGA